MKVETDTESDTTMGTWPATGSATAGAAPPCPGLALRAQAWFGAVPQW